MIDHDSTHASIRTDRAPLRARHGPSGSRRREADRASSAAIAGTFENVPIGDYLRRQRILRDVSIDELAAMTRIPLRSIERLERGELDGETDGFVRGFVRTVAEALGLDVEDTVARMLEEPVSARWDRHAPGRRTKQVAAGIAVVLLLGTGVLVLRAGWRVLAGAEETAPSRAVVVWRDPVRALAEASGAEVDPSLEIDPARGSRSEVNPAGAGSPSGLALGTAGRWRSSGTSRAGR